MSDFDPKVDDRLKGVYGASNRDELEAGYDAWSDDYDRDADDYFGWRGPQLALECFRSHVPLEARVLDAGAGTGRLGRLLVDAGYNDLTGFDLSRGMLEKAERLGVYQSLHHMALGDVLGFDDGAFDAIACIGTLTTGHAPAEGIDELVRVTRPGGFLVATLNMGTYGEDGIKDRIEAHEATGSMALVDSSDPLPLMPDSEPDLIHEVRVYRTDYSAS